MFLVSLVFTGPHCASFGRGTFSPVVACLFFPLRSTTSAPLLPKKDFESFTGISYLGAVSPSVASILVVAEYAWQWPFLVGVGVDISSHGVSYVGDGPFAQ